MYKQTNKSNHTSINYYKKKTPSLSNSHSTVKMTRSKTVTNTKENYLKNKNISQEKSEYNKQRNYSSNKLNNSENNINKQIQFKKQSSHNNDLNINDYNSNNNSHIREKKNNSVLINQEKSRILNSSENLNYHEKNIYLNNNNEQKIRRKKQLSVNTEYPQNESFGFNKTENNIQSYNNDININNYEEKDSNIKKIFKHSLINSGSMFNIKNNNLKEQPFKLYKENMNINEVNNNNYQPEKIYEPKFSNSLINIASNLTPNTTNINNNNNNISNSLQISINIPNKNTFNISAKEQLSKRINDIELNLNKNLLENTANSKSKKYNTIKHAFEDLIRLLNNINNKSNNTLNTLLQKLLIGYHEVVSSFSIENRELKQSNLMLIEKNKKLEKIISDSIINMNEKKREIDFLKRKISTMSLDTESNTNHIITSNDSNNINLFDKGSENEKIYNINKNNLDDLEALYFFDKINLNHKRSFSHNVPFIKLKKDEKNLRISPNKNNIKIFQNINNKIDNKISLENNNNSKYMSNFNMIKKQFI